MTMKQTQQAAVAAPVIAREEFHHRQRRLASEAAERGLDAVIVWSTGGSRLDSFGDVFYLTNHYSTESKTYNLPRYWTGFGHAAVIVPAHDSPCLLVHKPDWRHDLIAIDDVRACSDLYQGLIDYLQEKGLDRGTVGISREEYFPLPLHKQLTANYPRLKLLNADDLLETMRIVKSPAEVEIMRHASSVAVHIMDAMLEEAEVGATDGNLATAGYAAATALGATPWEFAMASGPHSEHMWWGRLPAFDARRRYVAGDIVHPDVYGCVDGYFYDFVRSTVIGGKASSQQRELLDCAIALVQQTTAGLRPGRRACDVHAEVLEWSTANGWEQSDQGTRAVSRAPLPFFAHGIGLGFEGPWITGGHDTILEPGMIVAVEICMLGYGMGVAHEDDVLITDEEPEVMTAACKERWWNP